MKEPVTAAVFCFDDVAPEKFLTNIFIGDLFIVGVASGHEQVIVTVQGLTENIEILKGMFKNAYSRNVKPSVMVG